MFSTSSSLTLSPPDLDLRGVVVHWMTISQENTSDNAPLRPKSSTVDSEDVSFAWCSCSTEGEGGKTGAKIDPNPTKGDTIEASPCAEDAVVREGEEAQGRAVYRGWLESPRGAREEVYSGEDLDILAMHFAVVKVCLTVRLASNLLMLCCKDFSRLPLCSINI